VIAKLLSLPKRASTQFPLPEFMYLISTPKQSVRKGKHLDLRVSYPSLCRQQGLLIRGKERKVLPAAKHSQGRKVASLHTPRRTLLSTDCSGWTDRLLPGGAKLSHAQLLQRAPTAELPAQ